MTPIASKLISVKNHKFSVFILPQVKKVNSLFYPSTKLFYVKWANLISVMKNVKLLYVFVVIENLFIYLIEIKFI